MFKNPLNYICKRLKKKNPLRNRIIYNAKKVLNEVLGGFEPP